MNPDKITVIAGCIVENDSKFLLVQEKQPKAYGLWNLPAGHVDNGEGIEQAAIREAKEETGFDVQVMYKIGTYDNPNKTHSINIYRAYIVGGSLNFPVDEILDASWFTYEEIIDLDSDGKLRGSFVIQSMNDLLGRNSKGEA